MTSLAQKFPKATGLKARALRQAARELLLAQASDWPFILRAGTSPDYARRRVKDHLLRFIALHDQLTDDPRGRKMAARGRIARQPFPRRGLELLEVTGESHTATLSMKSRPGLPMAHSRQSSFSVKNEVMTTVFNVPFFQAFRKLYLFLRFPEF